MWVYLCIFIIIMFPFTWWLSNLMMTNGEDSGTSLPSEETEAEGEEEAKMLENFSKDLLALKDKYAPILDKESLASPQKEDKKIFKGFLKGINPIPKKKIKASDGKEEIEMYDMCSKHLEECKRAQEHYKALKEEISSVKDAMKSLPQILEAVNLIKQDLAKRKEEPNSNLKTTLQDIISKELAPIKKEITKIQEKNQLIQEEQSKFRDLFSNDSKAAKAVAQKGKFTIAVHRSKSAASSFPNFERDLQKNINENIEKRTAEVTRCDEQNKGNYLFIIYLAYSATSRLEDEPAKTEMQELQKKFGCSVVLCILRYGNVVEQLSCGLGEYFQFQFTTHEGFINGVINNGTFPRFYSTLRGKLNM